MLRSIVVCGRERIIYFRIFSVVSVLLQNDLHSNLQLANPLCVPPQGAEWEFLQGIEARHWRRIEQVIAADSKARSLTCCDPDPHLLTSTASTTARVHTQRRPQSCSPHAPSRRLSLAVGYGLTLSPRWQSKHTMSRTDCSAFGGYWKRTSNQNR